MNDVTTKPAAGGTPMDGLSSGRLALERLEVRGPPRALGRGQGEHWRERVRTFVAMRFDAVRGYFDERAAAKGARHTVDELLAVGRRSARGFAAWDPDGFAEHLGIAEGAGIDPEELFTATNMTDMRDAVLLSAASGPPLRKDDADPDGCTSVLVPGSHTRDGAPLVGQTWDLNPQDLDFVVAVHRRPDEGPETWSLTCTGCLTLVGANGLGLAVGTTNIKTYGSRPGLGYLGVLHRVVRSRDAAEARDLVETAPHAGAHTFWLADGERMIELEASPNGVFPREPRDGPLARTNHCLFSEHTRIEGEVPNRSSRARLARAEELLSPGGIDVDGLARLFADRSRGVDSINRYPEDAQGTATNGVFIAAPRARRVWACRGPADRGAWVELPFAVAR